MRYRTFGRTGSQGSEIGFGGWAIGGGWDPQRDEESLAALHRALDLGVTFIDTAQGYGQGHSERLIGQVLRERGERVGASDIKVATKIPPRDGHWPPFPYDGMDARYPAAYLRQGVEESLQRLEAERLDLLRPPYLDASLEPAARTPGSPARPSEGREDRRDWYFYP